MHCLLALLLLAAPRSWATGVLGMPSEDGKKGKKARPARAGRGDVQVGPDAPLPGIGKDRIQASAQPARPASQKNSYIQGSRVAGIYPVYESNGRWLLIDRRKGRKKLASKGSEFVVIGSRGAGLFYASASTRTWNAACEGARHAPTPGYWLSARAAKEFNHVGIPVMAILLKKGKAFDAARAGFYPLKNEVKESTYQRLDAPLRRAVLADLAAGAYPMRVDDEEGRRLAHDPDPEKLHLKIEFGSKIRVMGYEEAFLTVEGTQVSQTPRRCMRLFSADRSVGECAPMPHDLMMETQLLNFVAYDPRRRGQPFVLAYSAKQEPLWGHERWGFQITQEGPKLFLQDALDPRCREGF